MKITVTANEFCPDDCLYCDIEKEMMRNCDGTITQAEYVCRNASVCRNANQMQKVFEREKKE